jgi:hypothetical protein
MIWDLQRLGLANSAVILALALVPLVALASPGTDSGERVPALQETETTSERGPSPDSDLFVVSTASQ